MSWTERRSSYWKVSVDMLSGSTRRSRQSSTGSNPGRTTSTFIYAPADVLCRRDGWFSVHWCVVGASSIDFPPKYSYKHTHVLLTHVGGVGTCAAVAHPLPSGNCRRGPSRAPMAEALGPLRQLPLAHADRPAAAAYGVIAPDRVGRGTTALVPSTKIPTKAGCRGSAHRVAHLRTHYLAATKKGQVAPSAPGCMLGLQKTKKKGTAATWAKGSSRRPSPRPALAREKSTDARPLESCVRGRPYRPSDRSRVGRMGEKNSRRRSHALQRLGPLTKSLSRGSLIPPAATWITGCAIPARGVTSAFPAQGRVRHGPGMFFRPAGVLRPWSR